MIPKFKEEEQRTKLSNIDICSYLVLFGEGLVAALLSALEVGAVFPGQVPPEGGEGEHFLDISVWAAPGDGSGRAAKSNTS